MMILISDTSRYVGSHGSLRNVPFARHMPTVSTTVLSAALKSGQKAEGNHIIAIFDSYLEILKVDVSVFNLYEVHLKTIGCHTIC